MFRFHVNRAHQSAARQRSTSLHMVSISIPKRPLMSRALLALALALAGPLAAHATAPASPSAAWDYQPPTGGITLGWNISSGATSYNIYRSTTSGGEGSTPYGNLAGGASNRYSDTAVTSGTTYYYKVTAVNASGESAQSMEASAQFGAARLSTLPALTATPGDGVVNLTWTAVPGATSYLLGRLINGSYIYQAGVTGTQLADTGLTNGTAYTYDIYANNNAGLGLTSSNTVTATPAPISSFKITVPGEITPSTSFTVTVTALLANGNPATTYTGTVRLSSDDTGATLGNINLSGGTGSYTPASMVKIGMDTITATDVTYTTVSSSVPIYVAPDVATSEMYIDSTQGWSTTPSPLSTLYAGTTYYAHAAIVNNTGSTWTSAAGYKLTTLTYLNTCPVWSLGIYLPPNTSIASGHTAHFDFPIVAPHLAGNYGFLWQMSVDNGSPFGPQYTLTSPPYTSPAPTTLTVLPTNILDGIVQLNDFPVQMTVGDRYDVNILVGNSGTRTMTPGDGLMVGLVAQTGSPTTTWGVTSTFGTSVYNAVVIPCDIPPSSTDNLHQLMRIPIVAPATPGAYHMRWQLEQLVNGTVTPFGTPSPDVIVNVVSTGGADAGSYVSQVVPSSVKGGQSFTASITFKNSGSTTWTSEHHYCIYPGSTFAWTGGHTIPVPWSVPPGDQVTFNFTATAPAYVSGGNNNYTFQWNLESNCSGFGTGSSGALITVTP